MTLCDLPVKSSMNLLKLTEMKTYRVLVEYWVPDEDENLWEEKVIQSRSSCGKIADNYLAQDRTNLIRSVEVVPI